MDAEFIWEIHNNIYAAKVNAIIPWAAVQRPSLWVGGDPNPGTAIRVHEGGHFSVEKGYHFFKQVCRAGQPGMAMTPVRSNDPQVTLIGFTSNGTNHPDAFIVTNIAPEPAEMSIRIVGAPSRFTVYRSSETEHYASLGMFDAHAGVLDYAAPAMSVTMFYAT